MAVRERFGLRPHNNNGQSLTPLGVCIASAEANLVDFGYRSNTTKRKAKSFTPLAPVKEQPLAFDVTKLGTKLLPPLLAGA